MEQQTNFLQENNIKIRSITNLVGCLLSIIAGLFFVFFTDVSIKFTSGSSASAEFIKISIWLFMAIIFAVIGGICFFIGDANKHKKVLTLVLKGIGIVLSTGFIFFLFRFQNWLLSSGRFDEPNSTMSYKVIINVPLVLVIVALVLLIINYVFSILFLEEDY